MITYCQVVVPIEGGAVRFAQTQETPMDFVACPQPGERVIDFVIIEEGAGAKPVQAALVRSGIRVEGGQLRSEIGKPQNVSVAAQAEPLQEKEPISWRTNLKTTLQGWLARLSTLLR